MNSIEEKLWDYIDGNCSDTERQAISKLIAGDEAYRIKYQELLSFNQDIAAMELDEPPMAFTYNVMETIRTETALIPLKAAINKRIILGIAAFFAITITVLLIYSMLTVKWTADSSPQFDMTKVVSRIPADIKMPNVKSYLTRPVIEGFLFFDVVLSMFFFDAWLRKRNVTKSV